MNGIWTKIAQRQKLEQIFPFNFLVFFITVAFRLGSKNAVKGHILWQNSVEHCLIRHKCLQFFIKYFLNSNGPVMIV